MNHPSDSYPLLIILGQSQVRKQDSCRSESCLARRQHDCTWTYSWARRDEMLRLPGGKSIPGVYISGIHFHPLFFRCSIHEYLNILPILGILLYQYGESLLSQ
jgi:hypothetical protein